MDEQIDPDLWTEREYADASNLKTRIAIQKRYRTNRRR